MRTSLEWIDGRAGNVGTLQIMLLSQQRFDEIYYYEYIDRLDREGVDVSQIRILPTMAGSKKQVSVVYGEYESWGAAGVAGADLPSVLQQASPIPRSVGALKTEMRRLERQN
jgi:septal ring-binding cell division protein DamX